MRSLLFDFLPDGRKLRISQDIGYVRATYIEFAMTIFEQCHNVLNNKSRYLVITEFNNCFIIRSPSLFFMIIFGKREALSSEAFQ